MDPICIICFDILTSTTPIVATECGHVGHSSCMGNWLQSSRSCPHCRRIVTKVSKVFLDFMHTLNSENVRVNLQNQLDDLDIQLRLKNRLIEESGAKIAQFETDFKQKNLLIDSSKNTIKLLEKKIEELNKNDAKVLSDVKRQLESLQITCTTLENSIADLTKQLEEERAKKREIQMSAAPVRVKENQNLGGNSATSETEKNVSKTKGKPRVPRAPLRAVNQNSEGNRYNLRPR